jgi:glucose/mannose-6-phosphate isomerase
VSPLDDERQLRAGDRSGMLERVAGLARQVREGYELGLAAPDLAAAADASAIAVCGMGGSAISGDVLRALAAPRLGIPVVVVRSPELPAWCGPGTLVVASSYSGETAETLAAFAEALRRGCRMLVVTSGGTLGERASELGLGRVLVPGGSPPRAAFGYLALGLLGALEAMGLLGSMRADVEEAAAEAEARLAQLAPALPTAANPAKGLAASIGERVPVIWGAEGIGSVAALRWKTQLNENGKVPAWSSALPELDHNEVVGWSAGRGHRFFVVALRHDGEPPGVPERVELSLEIARAAGAGVEEVWASGTSALARLLTLVAHGDMTATYLGLAHGEDPTEVEAIARLKRALGQP